MKEIIKIEELEFTLYQSVGKLIDQQTTSHTQIYGGGAYVDLYNNVISTPIQSSSHTDKTIFIQDQQGREQSFTFDNASIPAMRVGHTLQIIWLVPEKQNKGTFAIVRNVSQNDTSSFYRKIQSTGFLLTRSERNLLRFMDILGFPFTLFGMAKGIDNFGVSMLGFKCLYLWFVPFGYMLFDGWADIKVLFKYGLNYGSIELTLMQLAISLFVIIWILIYVWKKEKLYKKRVKIMKQEVGKRLV